MISIIFLCDKSFHTCNSFQKKTCYLVPLACYYVVNSSSPSDAYMLNQAIIGADNGLSRVRPKWSIWISRHLYGCQSKVSPRWSNCLLNRLLRCRSTKTSKLRVTGLCERNSPMTGEFPAQTASNAENVSIWWGHHGEPKQHKTHKNHIACEQ